MSKTSERVLQLVAAAADVGRTLKHLDRRAVGDQTAGLGHRRAVDANISCQQDRRAPSAGSRPTRARPAGRQYGCEFAAFGIYEA